MMIYRSSIFMILVCLITASLALAQTSVPISEQAEKLLSEGDVLVQNHNLQGALDMYKQAIPLYHDANDRQQEGATLFKIGLVYYKLISRGAQDVSASRRYPGKSRRTDHSG